ncbi:MAG TPA: 6-phosphogluconolactonase [Planctomycetota bacterium]|nr:6-phosphogluconolactonase [Planctomycetota bacterium]
MILRSFPSSELIARTAAQTFQEVVDTARREHRRATVALAGGSTPRLLYRLIAEELRTAIDWRHVEIFFGDERAVPRDHADSNFRMARETLLDRVPLPSMQIHPMDGGADDLSAAAEEYERILRERCRTGTGAFPAFDLLWLGMGDDGHTASLFPGTRALDETRASVVANDVPQLDTRRLTITFPVIAAARHVQFLVSGRGKAPKVAKVVELSATTIDRLPADAPPAARARPTSGILEWLVDEDAASDIERGA